jgi:hypothetical protein
MWNFDLRPEGAQAAARTNRVDILFLTNRNVRASLELSLILECDAAVANTIAEIDNQPNREPRKKPPPILNAQREHQEQAAKDPGNRNEGAERRPERPVHFGMGPAHDQNGGADDHKCEQRPDVHEIRKDPQR